LAPCEFFLFTKIKLKLKGRRFDTIEEIQAESQREFSLLAYTPHTNTQHQIQNLLHKKEDRNTDVSTQYIILSFYNFMPFARCSYCNVLYFTHNSPQHRFLIICDDSNRQGEANVVYGKEDSLGMVRPLQALTGPEGSRRLRLSDFKTICT
jgi:hypothetical protein